MCDECNNMPMGILTFKASCGQHWLNESGNWKAVTRRKYETHTRAALEEIIGPKLAEEAEQYKSPNPPPKVNGVWTPDEIREFENKWFAPWSADWDHEWPYTIYRVDDFDEVVFEWVSPFFDYTETQPKEEDLIRVRMDGLYLSNRFSQETINGIVKRAYQVLTWRGEQA